jgi:hypothetical protein
MNIIYCFEHTYKYLEDYILSILTLLTAKLEIFTNCLEITFEKQNNYIFVHSISYNLLSKITHSNVYLIATEQLCDPKKLKELYNSSEEKLNIIDYSLCNLQYYDSIKYNKKFFLPYQINYDEIRNIEKTHDVCLIGDYFIPPRRQHIIDELKKKNINVDIISGFGKSRDEQLFKYKIILNIGYFDYYKVFEHIRCDRCVYNKMIVISDLKDHMEGVYLKDHIIFESYDNIPNKVYEVLIDYDNYYHTLFSTFNFETISETLTNLSKDAIETLRRYPDAKQ